LAELVESLTEIPAKQALNVHYGTVCYGGQTNKILLLF
jgi:hypothetical protein